MVRINRVTPPEPPHSAATVAADVDLEPGEHPDTELTSKDGYTPTPRDNTAAVDGQPTRPPTKLELRAERYRNAG